MTASVSTARLTSALERIADTGGDDRALRARILEVLRRFVAFESYAFVLTDPVTTVGCSPVAQVSDVATLPELIRLKYLTALNRWTGLPARGCATLQQATAGRPELSLVWREHLDAAGVVDVLSVVFTDRFGCWGFLDLWRCGASFSEEEVAALAGVRSLITSRLRAEQAAAFTPVPTSASTVGAAVRQRGPGALVLSPSLAVRAQTPQTQDWLARMVPPEAGHRAIPAAAYNVAAQLFANEASVDAHTPSARVHLGGGVWLTLRADRVTGAEPLEDRDIVVTMEASSPTERRELFSRAHGLTGREDELLGHLADGADTRTAAALMAISEHTVQDHAKSVFAKTSTSSRRELLARSSGA